MSIELTRLTTQVEKNQAAEDEAVSYLEGLLEKAHEETDPEKVLEYAGLIGHVQGAVAAQKNSTLALLETLVSQEKAVKDSFGAVTTAGVSKSDRKKKEPSKDKGEPEEEEKKPVHHIAHHKGK